MVEEMRSLPRYPSLHIHLRSRNPFALVSAVRLAMRRSEVPSEEIARFTEEALRSEEPMHIRQVCTEWASVEC